MNSSSSGSAPISPPPVLDCPSLPISSRSCATSGGAPTFNGKTSCGITHQAVDFRRRATYIYCSRKSRKNRMKTSVAKE
ncbi:hypothetical protein B296_00042361, partial [Ensete ventricosum]